MPLATQQSNLKLCHRLFLLGNLGVTFNSNPPPFHSHRPYTTTPHPTVLPYMAAINTGAYFGNEVGSQSSISCLVLKSAEQ